MNLKNKLIKLCACQGAIEWVGERDLKTAWAECERADWMLWYAGRNKHVRQTKIVLAACACARTALQYVPRGEDRPRIAIEAAEKWAKNPTKKNKDAARAAWAAAGDAAWAAGAAAWAAGDAAWAARDAALKDMADLIRGIIKIR